MAKNRLNDFSTTADDNTDVAGVGIQGTNSPRNLDNAFRALMKIIADWREGTSLNATANFNDPDDTSKTFEFSGENIPTGTNREIDIQALYEVLTAANRAPIAVTYYITAGVHTHTFNEDARKFQLFGQGGGGGGGGVDGQGASRGGAASGGNSGNWGWTLVLNRPDSLEEGDIVIGDRGDGGLAGANNGSDGDDTTWADATPNAFTWKGGKGGIGTTANTQYIFEMPVENSSNTGVIWGTYRQGSPGISNGNYVAGAPGGSAPYGSGLTGTRIFSSSEAGKDGVGFGAGGGGAAASEVATNVAGGNGCLGMMIVVEY